MSGHLVVAAGDLQKGASTELMEHAHGDVDDQGEHHVRPVDPQDLPDQHFFEMLGAMAGAIEDDDARRRSDNVDDADDRFLRHPSRACSDK